MATVLDAKLVNKNKAKIRPGSVTCAKKSCQFRTKNFRQHGDNIRAAIHFEDQEFAIFTSGIKNLVLSFTDNEGEATNMCLVHIDPNGCNSGNLESTLKPVLYLTDKSRREIILAPHMWRITLNCFLDEAGETKAATSDGLDVTTSLDINSKTMYLGMDPDVDGGKWTCVKHPKKGLVVRVAKPKANEDLFKEVVEDRLRAEGVNTDDLERRLKRLKGFEKGYLGLHAVQLKAVIGKAIAMSDLLTDNDDVAGKMEGLKLLPETAVPFEMKRAFKPDMVDAQLVNCAGEVVRHGLSVIVDGKLGYINLPDCLPEGSYTVRLVKPINGHPPDVLEVKSFCIETPSQAETKKRKVEHAGLSPQAQGENLTARCTEDGNDSSVRDFENVINTEATNRDIDLNRSSPEDFEDLMEIIRDDTRTLNSAVLESDGHTLNGVVPPPRIKEPKLWDAPVGKTNSVSKEEMFMKDSSLRKWTGSLPQVLKNPQHKWIQYLGLGVVIIILAMFWEMI